MSSKAWDMAIIGAGPAGSVCACSALAEPGKMRVALVDRERFPRDKPCGDAIRHDAVRALRELDLGGIFSKRSPIRRIEATFPPGFEYLQKFFETNEYTGPDGHAYYIVERMAFDHFLFKAAVRRGAQDYTGYRLTNAQFDQLGNLWTLTLKNQCGATTGIRCRTLVGADGAGSRVRRLAGLERNRNRHTSLALRAYARAEGLAEQTMRFDYLESLIPGYAWTFPLAEGMVNIGIYIHKLDFKRAKRRLESYLDEYLGYLRGKGIVIENLDGIKAHPLPLASQPPPLVPGQQVALIGDAASMIDPFTGEGIHFGIWAGRALGRAVSECAPGGNVQTGLKRYANAYAEQFAETMKFCEEMRVRISFQKFLM